MSIHKTFLERAISLMPFNYYRSALALSAVLFLVALIIMLFVENSLDNFISYFLLCAIFAQQTIILYWSHEKIRSLRDIFLDIIDLQEKEIIEWHINQEMNIFNNSGMFLMGIFFNIAAHESNLDQLVGPDQANYNLFYVRIFYYLVHLFMGAGLYSLFATALMIHRMGALPMRVNILLTRNLQLKGVLYSKFTICAASVYVMWGLFYLSTPLGLSALHSIMWFSSFAILLCAYLILPQYSIHQMMIKTKKDKLKVFSSALREKADGALKNPTKENALRLKNMLDIQCHLDEMCQWPFGSYEVLHITLIIIIPFAVVALEIIFGVIKA
jgi:hypothetical protein